MSAEAQPFELAKSVLDPERTWFVGGVIRDRLAARGPQATTLDVDLIVDGDGEQAARQLRDAAPAGAAVFTLSDQFGAWRVCSAYRDWQIDCTPLQGETLEADLRARDLTINAIAEPLAGGELIDPTGGLEDLQLGVLRAASADAPASPFNWASRLILKLWHRPR